MEEGSNLQRGHWQGVLTLGIIGAKVGQVDDAGLASRRGQQVLTGQSPEPAGPVSGEAGTLLRRRQEQ